MQSIQTTLSPVIKRDLRQPTQNPAHTAESAKKSESIQTSPRSATAIENAQRGQILSSPTNPLSALISTLSATARLLKPLLVLAVISSRFEGVSAEGLTESHRQLTIPNAEVLEDFESYSIGSRLQSPPWTMDACTGSIVANDRGGKAFKGGSCYLGQHTERSYSFNFESDLKKIDMIFSSRMNSLSGHTVSEVGIGSSTQLLGFGQYRYQPFITSPGMYLDKVFSAQLPSSTWYQFKLSVDFDSQKASLFYRNLGNDDWVSINDLQNITTTIDNPSSLNKLYLRTDTLSNDGGYIDDVLLVRGDLQELEDPTSAPTSGPSGTPSGNPSTNPSSSPSAGPTISTSPPTGAPTTIRQLGIQDCNTAAGSTAKFECLITGLNSVSSDVDTLKIDVASLETFHEEQILLNEDQAATNLAVQQQLTDLETQFTSDISTLRSDIATNTGKITTAENRLNATEANVAAQTTKLHDFMNAQNATNIGLANSLSEQSLALANVTTALNTFKDTQGQSDAIRDAALTNFTTTFNDFVRSQTGANELVTQELQAQNATNSAFTAKNELQDAALESLVTAFNAFLTSQNTTNQEFRSDTDGVSQQFTSLNQTFTAYKETQSTIIDNLQTAINNFITLQNEKNALVGTQIGELRTLFTGFNSSNSQNPDISHLTRQFGNYSMALETLKTTQAATDTSIADLRYDFTTYQDTSAQQFATLTQTNAAILSDVATLHSSQADTDASVDSLQRNFTSYQGNAAQQFYELTQADIQQYRAIDEFKSAQAATDAKLTAQVTNQSVTVSEFKTEFHDFQDTQTDTDHRQNLEIAALKDQIAKLSDSDSDEGIHFGGTHIDYATLAIGSITALSVGIIGALSWCLSSAKKDHKELAESTNILAAGLASASNPQLQQLREEVRGKATTLSALVGQRQNIQHQLNVSLNTRPTEAPAILRTVLDADTAIEAYLNIPIEDRTQKDTSKFTGNLAILSANNRENSPLELAIQSVRTDISGIQRIIAEAQSSVITVTGEKV